MTNFAAANAPGVLSAGLTLIISGFIGRYFRTRILKTGSPWRNLARSLGNFL